MDCVAARFRRANYILGQSIPCATHAPNLLAERHASATVGAERHASETPDAAGDDAANLRAPDFARRTFSPSVTPAQPWAPSVTPA
ncbi:hypothetical protein Mkiyose1665_24080 [Mycobacterium kiyosense]|uniref:Uncharacterized protein n=1 Tax=Mycobacterium kiyosense TaxID=2871094 RepID=A0A9P3UYX5_9MYCO|nr:hypothetical protein IWGMT90018_49460 [Mycobacterium kiyosense]BDE16012.1 hypothetical protein MKCMC460_48720 [Mycobacterium sp. 20KCMC460]GLB81843.1 hypothetical protein SRL2020028_10990 [Mycobacterium kiyosense]GLB91309.1 hypothetical protein SRL2020130_41260 [Mycobacterium kiyosense]GLB97326.1 hypothetical protein SRL2020226_41020 [Mycobacterium kiyosense]